jgi:hypothetical protein
MDSKLFWLVMLVAFAIVVFVVFLTNNSVWQEHRVDLAAFLNVNDEAPIAKPLQRIPPPAPAIASQPLPTPVERCPGDLATAGAAAISRERTAAVQLAPTAGAGSGGISGAGGRNRGVQPIQQLLFGFAPVLFVSRVADVLSRASFSPCARARARRISASATNAAAAKAQTQVRQAPVRQSSTQQRSSSLAAKPQLKAPPKQLPPKQ